MNRYHKLDEIRGITLISMILYHGCWDAVYILGYDWEWYGSELAYVWQQSIAWTFILLSGFCWQLGKRRLRRGLTVFGGGLLVTAVTVVVMPESRIVFGVLTLIGSCMLLTIPLDAALRKTDHRKGEDAELRKTSHQTGEDAELRKTSHQNGEDAADERGGSEDYSRQGISSQTGDYIGLVISAVLFLLTRNVNSGWLGFESINIVQLPHGWYCNELTTYLGFPAPGFFSTDYFSLIPWFFLFICGYFLFSIMEKAGALQRLGRSEKFLAPLRWMGHHSLLVYLLHQPMLYGLVVLVM